MERHAALSSQLWDLGKAIIALAKSAQENGLVAAGSRAYVKPKFSEFEFKDGTVRRMQWTYENVERVEWSWKDIMRFLEDVKSLPGYERVRDLLSRTYSVQKDQADFWLSRFAQAVAGSALEDHDEPVLIQTVTMFLSDIEGSPKTWTIVAWLNGIWTTDDQVTITETTKIRQPKQADFEQLRPADLDPSLFRAATFPGTQSPNSVMHLSIRAKNQPDATYDLDTLYVMLRLFGIGSVAPMQVHWDCDTLLGFRGFTTGPSIHGWPGDKYAISAADAERLSSFMTRIRPLVPPELVRGGEKTDYMVTSLQRYNDALLKPEPPESRLSFCVMSLEALYLKSGEREELEHRLSQRIAKVLSAFGDDPMEAYNTLRHTYEIRSKFVHGEPLEKSDRGFAAENIQRVLGYVRKSLVVMLQTREKTPKEQLLNLVDNSLLSQAADKKLSEKLKETCTVL